MVKISRREILTGAALLTSQPALAVARDTVASEQAVADPPSQRAGLKDAGQTKARPFIHTTDLYRPHLDPDDHWDLATGYALAEGGDLDLKLVLIDNPSLLSALPNAYKLFESAGSIARSPDVAAVAQMNYLSDELVPITVGLDRGPASNPLSAATSKGFHGVGAVIQALRDATSPVSILIGGSCQDIAVAGRAEPQLFAKKCSGIYLNAGIGSPKSDEQQVDGVGEWNVVLNPQAYQSIFDIPCPIYWMPCFSALHKGEKFSIGEFGTYWLMKQGDVLPHFSPRLQAYFAFALSRSSATDWLSYLLAPDARDRAEKYYQEDRGMFSTAGFIHAAGKVVTMDGHVVSMKSSGVDPLYEFVAIDVNCDQDGITQWHPTSKSSNRYIFRVRDTGRYAESMSLAVREILTKLS